jgi:serine/threonine protein kinase
MHLPAADPWIEAILNESLISGRFTDLEILGDPTRGYFSYVFHALDIQSNRRVVLKFLRPDRMHQPPWDDYFQREGEVSLALTGYDGFVQLVSPPDVHTVTMTLANGAAVNFSLKYLASERAVRDLDTFLFGPRRRPAVLWRRLQIVRDIVKSVARLHRLGYCHRDLKPDNILLFPGGDAKLGDLGLCRHVDDPTLLRADYSQPVGHRMYAAPETFCGSASVPSLFSVADWFSVGAILFEAIAGVKLYVAIGLQQPRDIVVAFSLHGPLNRFEQVVADISGTYPIPVLEDFTAADLLRRHSPDTLSAVDSLIRRLCHFDYRRRLIDVTRIIGHIDFAIALSRRDELRRTIPLRRTGLLVSGNQVRVL